MLKVPDNQHNSKKKAKETLNHEVAELKRIRPKEMTIGQLIDVPILPHDGGKPCFIDRLQALARKSYTQLLGQPNIGALGGAGTGDLR